MMPRPKRKHWSHFLGPVVLLLFIALAAWVWMPTADSQVSQRAQPVPRNISHSVDAGQKTLAELVDVTTNRPLFHVSRRPEAAPEAPPKPPEPTLSLVGIISDDGRRFALLRISNSPQLYRIEQGGQLGRWTINEVTKDRVSVTKDSETPMVLSIGR